MKYNLVVAGGGLSGVAAIAIKQIEPHILLTL